MPSPCLQSSAQPAPGPGLHGHRCPFEAPGVQETQPAPKPQEPTGGDEEAFRTLALKMDEYQDLLSTCNSLAQTEENREVRGSCDARLKALRQELSDLTDRLQVQPK